MTKVKFAFHNCVNASEKHSIIKMSHISRMKSRSEVVFPV